jgi:hypothetical protein
MQVGERLDADWIVLRVAAETKGLGEGGFALNNKDGAAFDARWPFGRSGRAGARDEDAGEGWRLRDEAYGG